MAGWHGMAWQRLHHMKRSRTSTSQAKSKPRHSCSDCSLQVQAAVASAHAAAGGETLLKKSELARDCSHNLIKMGSASGIVIGVSLVFYLVAFGLALGAMAKRSKGDLTLVDEDLGMLKCQYTTDIATGFAAGAFIFLLVAQMFVMAVTRCLCCGSGYKPGGARTLAVIVFIFSWMSFIIASAALLAGASQNKIQTKGLFYQTGPEVTCRQVQKSLFAAASAFTFITMLMTEIYYVLISRAREGESSWQSYHGGPSVGMSAYT